MTQQFLKNAFNVTRLSGRLKDVIQERCGGRPGFIAEYVDMLKEEETHLWTREPAPGDKQPAAKFINDIDQDIENGVPVYFPIPPKIHSCTAAIWMSSTLPKA